MTVTYLLLILLAVKLPLVIVGWLLYRVIHDVPEPEVDRGDSDFVRADFDPGPRTRGPHGGGPAVALTARRGASGHEEFVQSRDDREVGSGEHSTTHPSSSQPSSSQHSA